MEGAIETMTSRNCVIGNGVHFLQSGCNLKKDAILSDRAYELASSA